MGRTGADDLRGANRVARMVEAEPKLVARHLAEHMWLEAKERELLLNSLLEAPVSAGSMSALSRALMASDEAGTVLGEELLDYLLSYPLTDRQAAACLDEAGELAAMGHEQLTEERRKVLLEALLKLPVPEGTVPELAQVLAGQKLYKEQRRVLLDNILKEPVPAENVADMAQAVAGIKLPEEQRRTLLNSLLEESELLCGLSDDGVNLPEEQRKALLEAILRQPLPEGTVPELAQVLAGQKLYKEQRRVLLDNILKEPVPAENVADMAQALAAQKLHKEQRCALLEALLQQPLPSEIIPEVKRALERCGKKAAKAEQPPADLKEEAVSVDLFAGLREAAEKLDAPVLSVKEKLIFFEGDFFEKGNLTDEMELLLFIADYIGKENIVVKRSPGNRVDRFTPLGFKVLADQGLPWEAVCMGMDLADKVLVGAAVPQCFSAARLYGQQSRSILLHPLLRGEDREQGYSVRKALLMQERKEANREKITCWAPGSLKELELVLDAVGEQIGGWN